MPHLTIEYSANLDAEADMAALCETLRQAMLATGLFETGAVRVRAIRCDAFAVADALARNGFADMVLRVGAGRDRAALKQAGDAVFAAAEAFLAPLFETPHFALSFEIREIDPGLSWKRNAMHARLRGT